MIDLQLSAPCSVRNTFLRSTDGTIQYYIETPHSWGLRKSKVTRWDGPKRDLIATIDWNIIELPRVRFIHKVIEDDAFLKRGRFNKVSCHVMTTPDGSKYEWRSHITPELFIKHGGKSKADQKSVAKYKHANWLTGKRPHLLVDESMMDILDQIVVSFVIIENMRMERSHY